MLNQTNKTQDQKNKKQKHAFSKADDLVYNIFSFPKWQNTRKRNIYNILKGSDEMKLVEINLISKQT